MLCLESLLRRPEQVGGKKGGKKEEGGSEKRFGNCGCQYSIKENKEMKRVEGLELYMPLTDYLVEIIQRKG